MQPTIRDLPSTVIPPSSNSFARSHVRAPDASRLVAVRVDGNEVQVPYGTPVRKILTVPGAKDTAACLAAIVHHRCVDLTYPLCAPSEVFPVTYNTREGILVYRRTASLLLLEAARRLWGNVRVTIGQALGNGYYYHVHRDTPLSREQVRQLSDTMRQLVKENLPIESQTVSIDEARALFRHLGLVDKLRLLQTYWEPFVTLVRCGGFCDIHHYPVAPSAGFIKSFELVHYPPGLILRFPPRGHDKPIGQYRDTPKLFQVYQETRQWNRIIGVEDVGQLNDLIVRGQASEVIRVAEGLHEKKIAHIADQITGATRPVKLVLIAGPAASGKTTFSKRLSLQLRVNGVIPVALSMDNFYVNRIDTPLGPDGKYDFESINAIDLKLFNEVLARLLAGERVMTPKFDFQTGMRTPQDRWESMQLHPGQVLMVEGIHGLNDQLTASIDPAFKFKVYVSNLTQLCIDDHNRIFTSDSRFLRRIVRDRLFRGYSAAVTIENWPAVRLGEQRNIFPYQEKADVMFNSALVYEQSVLRLFAERYLLEVPQNHASFGTAYRLLKFVQNFTPIFETSVPQISLLREFIGGSGFKY